MGLSLSLKMLTMGALSSGAGAAFSPGNVSGQQIWLDAALGTYTDTGGTTPAESDGDAVKRIEDQSGSSRNFTQSASTNPVLKTGANGINGLPVLLFSNDFMTHTASIPTNTEGTVFAVLRTPGSVAGRQFVFSAADTAANNNYVLLDTTTNNANIGLRQRNNDDVDEVRGDTTITTDTEYVMMWRSDGSLYSFRVNGVSQSITVALGSHLGDWFGDTDLMDTLAIGAQVVSVAANHFNGALAELIMYDSALDLSTIQQIETYLSEKYNISLGSGSGTLWLDSSVPVPEPDIYGTGVAVGDVATGRRVFGSATDYNDLPVNGTLTCINTSGNTVWSYNTANDDSIMGVAIGDVDGDGDNEVACGTRYNDHMGAVIDKNGNELWTYDNGVDTYVRSAAIGKLRSDHAGNQVVFGGLDGTLILLDKDGNVIWAKTGATSLCAPTCGTSDTTVQAASIADTDEDGQNEILIAYGPHARKYDHTGSQSWTTEVATSGYCYGIAAGDITSDTGLQIAVPDEGGNVIVLDKDGTVLQTNATPSKCWSVAVGDVDGDGKDEVFAGFGTHVLESPPALGHGGVRLFDGDGSVLFTLLLPSSVKFLAYDNVRSELVASCDDGNIHIVKVL